MPSCIYLILTIGKVHDRQMADDPLVVEIRHCLFGGFPCHIRRCALFVRRRPLTLLASWPTAESTWVPSPFRLRLWLR
uniref:Predicted protein n=1 Tax=Hordeum vulgare subsp. vulgare TaxID=112509 RepID=F2EA91_HORVV|nr:predicted protein [Hordeum vulgare subsp. vulgare]